MSGKSLSVAIAILSLISIAGSVKGSNSEIVFRAGIVCPSGAIDRYVDTSLSLSGKVVFHFHKADMFGLSVGLHYIPFSSQTQEVAFNRSGYASTAMLTSSENAWGLVIGGQFGSPSRNAFFRPYADAGVGMYMFSSDNTYHALNSSTFETDEIEDNTDTRLRPGVEFGFGSGLFFKRTWGLGMDFTYNYVLGIRHPGPTGEEKSSVRFFGVSLMVIFQLDHLEGK